MKNAVIYIRVKTDLSEESLKAVSVQAQQCKAYADANGLNIVGLYSDIIVFGTKSNLVGWKAILNSAEPNFDCVLVYDYGRIGRDIHSVIADVKKLHGRGIEVISVTSGTQNFMQFKEIFNI